MFEKGDANWLSELPSVIKQYNNKNHSSRKLTASQASEKGNDKVIISNPRAKRERKEIVFKLGQLVRTADNKKVFIKSDSTNWSFKLNTITEVIHVIIPSYRLNYLPERYNQSFLRPTKITFEENNQVMLKSNSTQQKQV